MDTDAKKPINFNIWNQAINKKGQYILTKLVLFQKYRLKQTKRKHSSSSQ